MLEDLRTFFVQSMPLLFSVSFCMCFFSFVLGGVILVSHFTNYISMLCASMEIGKPAGCAALCCRGELDDWLYGVCVVTEMPMDITLDTWALWLLCFLSLLYLYNACAWL